MHQENKINLSLIIPVFNEKNFLVKLFDELKYYFNSSKNEVIFIDDGSTDGSTNILKDLKRLSSMKAIKISDADDNQEIIDFRSSIPEFIDIYID